MITSDSFARRPALSSLVLAVPLLLSACKPETGTTSPTPDDPALTEAEEIPSGDPVLFASPGVPHIAAITLVALDPSGTAALTRDTPGGVRLWRALDGTREPLVVPIRDPKVMALAARGDGWTLALLDGAGGARLVGVDEQGRMEPLASLPPTDPLLDVVVLPGGERLLAIGSDHVIRLLDRHGKPLATIDEHGLRPASLRIAPTAEGGPVVVAVTAGEFDSKQARFAVELIPISLAGDSLALTGERRTIFLDSPATFDNPTIAPDGRSAVYLQRVRLGAASWAVRAMQLADGLEVSVDSKNSGGQQPRVGLLAAGRVLLDDGTGLGRVVDLRERKVELLAVRSSPTINHLASVFAGDLRVAPANNWLAVHDLVADDLRYLGYEQINVVDAGLSPSGASVAWALGDRVSVEAVGSNQAFEVPGTRFAPQRFVEFLDEDRLVTLDWAGGAQLINWRDGSVVAAIDVGNQVQMVDLSRSPEGDAIMLIRTNLWQNPTLLAIEDGQFGPRYLTRESSNFAGLLTPTSGGFEEWGAWTLDGNGRLRQWTLAQMRDGLDLADVASEGEVLSFGLPEQFIIDGANQQYWVRTADTHPTLHVERRGATSREVELAVGFVVRISPSPDGSRLAVIQQRDANQLVTVLDTKTLQPLWGQPLPSVSALAWSDSGDRVAFPTAFGGGVVFDGADGSTQTTRCGLGFEVRRSPPQNIGFFAPMNVCELP